MASTRSRPASMYSARIPERETAFFESFCTTTNTGKTPCMYGFVFPNALCASASVSYASAAIVTPLLVCFVANADAGPGSNLFLSLSIP